MFQKFIPQISKGDKRVFIINGKIKGAISRLPKKGSILSNMSKGASAKKIEINKHETMISKIVAHKLKKQNIYFAGIDFIQGKLIGDIKLAIREAILDGKIENNYESAFEFMLEKGKEFNLVAVKQKE